ncbi:hypothetical protein ACHAXA_001525 [Cyclostephanos tholiformis]|uniref:Uncharacterized protein n=1 Tax=Cyclostephanos tholiformis TaxID=382380 RepID=A0ABD3RX74_9STRA
MNRLFANLIVIVISTAVPSSSALLFSPLLLASNPWGVAERRAGASSNAPTPQIPRVKSSSTVPNFAHDDDLMRYKHELMSDIYEKSLNRGFIGGRVN